MKRTCIVSGVRWRACTCRHAHDGCNPRSTFALQMTLMRADRIHGDADLHLGGGLFRAEHLRLDRMAQVRHDLTCMTSCARAATHRNTLHCFAALSRGGIANVRDLDAATYRAVMPPCRYISFIYYGYGLLLHVEYNGRTIYRCVQHAQHVPALTWSVEPLCLVDLKSMRRRLRSIVPACVSQRCHPASHWRLSQSIAGTDASLCSVAVSRCVLSAAAAHLQRQAPASRSRCRIRRPTRSAIRRPSRQRCVSNR